eukprot:scaffold379_cov71-Cyclotella_meneghiniana.AAC.7
MLMLMNPTGASASFIFRIDYWRIQPTKKLLRRGQQNRQTPEYFTSAIVTSDNIPLPQQQQTDLPSSEGNSNTDGGEERGYNVYACMEPEDWKKVGGRAQAHTIATNITDEELAALKGGRGDV